MAIYLAGESVQPLENLNLLVVEDHHDLASTVIEFLESMGATVDYAADGMTALHVAKQAVFDVIIMDVMLPGIDGFSLCKQMREQEQAQTPILMMTARDELADKLNGFEVGADDYVVKPFDLPELVARVRSLHKRNAGIQVSQQLSVDDITLDLGTHTVHRGGEVITVTPVGFEILAALLRQSPNIVSREELEQKLWGDELPASDTLRSQIYKLRKALDKPFAEKLLHTIAGTGYRIGKADSDGSATT